MRRCDERLEYIEKRMANMEEGPVLRAFTSSTVKDASARLEDIIGQLKMETNEKFEDIEIDHLHVRGLIGPNEDCKFRNVYSFVKDGLENIRSIHDAVAEKLLKLKVDYEDFSKKTGHAVRTRIPTQMKEDRQVVHNLNEQLE